MHTRDVIWVGGGHKKNSGLFIDPLRKLDVHYREAALIHAVLDNYSIHPQEPRNAQSMRCAATPG